MDNEITRAYSFGDAFMLETADTLHGLFTLHMADFTALDSSLDAAFALDWLAKIDAARNIVSDILVVGIQADKTSDVLDQMELCRIKYNEVKYFVIKTFPRDKEKQGKFGLQEYNDVRLSQSKMLEFMDDLHQACENNSVELLAAGMLQTQIDDVATLRESLRATNKDQEMYMRERPVLTKERILALNICYWMTMLVVEAAQVVYYNDYVRRRSFVFNPTGGSSPGNDSAIVNIHVPNDENTVLAYTIPYIATRQIRINNTGPADIEVYLSNTSGVSTIMNTIVSSMEHTYQSSELGTDGNNLYLKASMSPEPHADVEVEISL